MSKRLQSFAQFIVEDTSKKNTPEAGSPLYHISAVKWKDDSKFHEHEDYPTHWFTSGSKGFNGHEEIKAAMQQHEYEHKSGENKEKSKVHIRKLNPGTKLASEHDVRKAYGEITGQKHGLSEHPVYSLLDPRVQEYPREHVNATIANLKKKGFHGAVHIDYSMKDPQKDMRSVALFHPNESSTHIKVAHTPEEIDAHQNSYETTKGNKNGSK